MADVALHPFPPVDPDPASSGLIAPDRSPSGRRFIHTLLNDAARADDVFAAEAVYARTPDIAPPTLPLDDAVAAILMGDAFEEMCDAYQGLREDAALIVVVVPDATIMHAFELVATRCLLDEPFHPARFDSRETSMVLICDSMAIDKPQLERDAMEAMAAGVSVCALAVDPARTVPAPLRAMIDQTIRTPRWSPARLSLLLEAVTGETVDVRDAPWITSVIVDDLRTSVSSRRGAAGSLARLEKTVARRTATTDAAPDLRDLSGYGVAKDIALGLIDDLQAFDRGEIPWSAVERGILLEGPPGTGKSLFASAFARTAGLPLVRGSLAIWQAAGTGHLGDLLQAMQTTFAEARALAPAVLFIDEIDSFGDRASFAGRHRDYGIQVLNAFLEQLDGGADRTGVVVLGATNRREAIDPAILRPGRFDRLIAIQLPDADALTGILRTCLGADRPDADLRPLALAARGASGAQVAAWVRRARGAARRADRPLLVEDVARAIAEDRAPLPPDIRRRVAVHEAGHAVATLALGLGTLDELVLTERGGFATSVPTPAVLTRSRGLAEIVRLLAGRAAEIVLYGAPSAGAGGGPHSDIGCATRIALGIEGSWGLGEAGPIHLGDVDDPSTASMVLHTLAPAVRRLLRHAEAEAERLVRANLDAILRCAARLAPVGRLNGEEATMAIGAVESFALASDSPAADGVVRPGVRA